MGRHLTTAVTMFVLVGIVVFAAVWGWNSLFAEVPSADDVAGEAEPTCDAKVLRAGQKLKARDVQVSVFNAGGRSGLAGETLDALTQRGFASGEVGNAPSDIEVRRVQVWSTVENDPRARLVALQFGGTTRVHFADEDFGAPGVDVFVGNGFKSLAKAPRALKVDGEQEVCLPAEEPAPAA